MTTHWPAHGTWARYVAQCRCDLCTAAAAGYRHGVRVRSGETAHPDTAVHIVTWDAEFAAAWAATHPTPAAEAS